MYRNRNVLYVKIFKIDENIVGIYLDTMLLD